MDMTKGLRTCFLIDDDADDQEIFVLAVKSIAPQIRCITADDGIHALELLHEDPAFTPDFIFLDLNMPRMAGKECLKELKKIDRLHPIKITIYTTSFEDRDKKEMLNLGAAHFLTKPSDISQLKRSLIEIMGLAGQ